MPANEGGTHGPCERVRSDGESRRRTPMNAGFRENLTDAGGLSWRRYSRPPTGSRPYRAARRSLSRSSAVGPRRLTPLVPLRQHSQGLVVVQRESADEPAADPERVDIAMLSGNRGRDRGQSTSGLALRRHVACREAMVSQAAAGGGSGRTAGKLAGPNRCCVSVILDAHEVWVGILVIQKPGQSGCLSDWGGGRVCRELACELLLQAFNVAAFESVRRARTDARALVRSGSRS